MQNLLLGVSTFCHFVLFFTLMMIIVVKLYVTRSLYVLFIKKYL